MSYTSDERGDLPASLVPGGERRSRQHEAWVRVSPGEPSGVDFGGRVVVSPETPLGPLVAAAQKAHGVAYIGQGGAVLGGVFERSLDAVA